MKLILVTGMSGAGKSVALKTLEDSGFEAIDNIPLAFLPAAVASGVEARPLAVGVDIRGRDFSAGRFAEAINTLKANKQLDFTLLFLDSDDEILRRRFTETRRRHPLALDRTIPDGIRHERELVGHLRDVADHVIDTSEYEAAELRQVIISRFAEQARELSVTLTAFSFKRGVPREADMVFDVRFLRNPYYEPTLSSLNGLDAAVGDYIEKDPGFKEFFDNLTALIVPLLPRYVAEGKHYLTIGIGCTGGQHRSVHVAQKLGGFLQKQGYNITLRYRDMI